MQSIRLKLDHLPVLKGFYLWWNGEWFGEKCIIWLWSVKGWEIIRHVTEQVINMYFSVIWYLFFTNKNETVFILFKWIISFFYHFISLHVSTRHPSQINSTVSMSGLHAVSSSDDVKPPFGLRPLSAHSPGPMVSQKRLCAICGDRSSGTSLINTNPNPSGGNTEIIYFDSFLLNVDCYWLIL